MTETPKYSLLKKQNGFELRQYAGYIQAEVDVVDRDYRSAIGKGFGVLAGYIFGNNIPNQKIDMSTPVQASRSRKLAMTAPVTVTGKDTFTVAFIMPSEETLETLPIPKDERIRFNRVLAHQVAVIRFSGYFQQGRIDRNKQLLNQWLKAQGLETEDDFIVAGYNPPWVPGFLARNEVLIRVKAQ